MLGVFGGAAASVDQRGAGDPGAPSAGPWVVDDGLAGFGYRAGRWEFRNEPLDRFVRWALEGQVVPAGVLPRYRRVYRVVNGQQRRFTRDRWWTSQRSVTDQDRHEVMRQGQEAAQAEREEAAARRREELAEQERARRAAEEERRRLEQEERTRVFMKQMEARWAEDDARRERERVERAARLAREQAEKEERERQALQTARAWWGRLSSKQQTELLPAVAEYAWRTSSLRLDISEELKIWPQYAYGVPLVARDRRRTLYGIVLPCPDLAAACPALKGELSWPGAPRKNANSPRSSPKTGSCTSACPNTNNSPWSECLRLAAAPSSRPAASDSSYLASLRSHGSVARASELTKLRQHHPSRDNAP
ncbi:hypothetical protein ACF09E_35440 [Streptomyces sp. NPDC014891]|uniref:hypothetical protein n=1 Tax=Streptomyces sp. NPDC014891 TaxID=3364929 RepID=UPI0036F6CECB